MGYIISDPETGRDMVALRSANDVKSYLNSEKPSAVKILTTKVHDGRGRTFKIRQENV